MRAHRGDYMRYSIIIWTFIGFGTLQTISAMENAAPAQAPAEQPAQQPVQQPAVQPAAAQQPAAQPAAAAPAQPAQQQPAAARVRQHFNTIFNQFDALNNAAMAHELDEVNAALTALQGSIAPYRNNNDNNHYTANTAKVIHSFFEKIKNKLAECRTHVGQLPAAGYDWLEQEVRHNQLNAIHLELATVNNQLITLFRILRKKPYRLAETPEQEHAMAMRAWQDQSKVSLANTLFRTGLSYGWNRLTNLGNPQSITNALNAAKQEADDHYTKSLIGQRGESSHLFDLAGRLGGYGFGRYNWIMPHLIAASNHFLPDEQDGEPDPHKHQINKIMNLLSLVDRNGRERDGMHEGTVPIERPRLIRFAIRYVPTFLFRWMESAIRTSHAHDHPRTWGAWIKSRVKNYSSRLTCAFLRAALGPSYYSLEGGVFRQRPISSFIAQAKNIYQHPLGRQAIDLGIDLAAYHAPEIRAGAAAINGWLANWKECANASNQQALRARATAARQQKNLNLMNDNMRQQLDEWGHHWHAARHAA